MRRRKMNEETKEELSEKTWDQFEAAPGQYTYVPKEPPKKKNKIPGMIVLALGVVLLIAGIAIFFVSANTDKMESGEAIEIYYATETDQYSFCKMQYMSDSIASYDALENLQFYFSFDDEFVPVIICMHNDDLPRFEPYIDAFYSEDDEDLPKQMTVTGYAQPIDSDLKEIAIECFTEIFGEGYVDEGNFEDWFGSYYLQIGQKNSAYGVSNVGIGLLLAAIILIVIGGVMVYEKPETYANSPFVQETHTGLGILGALLGAMLGGLLWTIVGVLGYIHGLIGILIIIFALKGYEILARKSDVFGMVISIIFGLLVIIPATYLFYGWDYYCMLNEHVSGYTNLWRALTEMPAFLTQNDAWGDFIADVGQGYLWLIVAAVLNFASLFSNKKKNR